MSKQMTALSLILQRLLYSARPTNHSKGLSQIKPQSPHPIWLLIPYTTVTYDLRSATKIQIEKNWQHSSSPYTYSKSLQKSRLLFHDTTDSFHKYTDYI